jgi:hypothetical protein
LGLPQVIEEAVAEPLDPNHEKDVPVPESLMTPEMEAKMLAQVGIIIIIIVIIIIIWASESRALCGVMPPGVAQVGIRIPNLVWTDAPASHSTRRSGPPTSP